jgi:hypothetical protein
MYESSTTPIGNLSTREADPEVEASMGVSTNSKRRSTALSRIGLSLAARPADLCATTSAKVPRESRKFAVIVGEKLGKIPISEDAVATQRGTARNIVGMLSPPEPDDNGNRVSSATTMMRFGKGRKIRLLVLSFLTNSLKTIPGGVEIGNNRGTARCFYFVRRGLYNFMPL